MASFQARTSREPGRTVVRLAGECDLAARDRLTGTLLGAVDDAPVVVVDLAAVEFLDSTGIHALVTAHHRARAADSRLYLVNATGAVATLLELTGVGDLLRHPGDATG
ncbi:STAS domain-containing protein [Micromonospora sp. MA102]|uniref:STAS domain-containing protein n=1 Tax=Micromonospora sp. MA102 TaxID=2952755 RepID=UPI0021C729F1|nr:STAS domain-containing protein [Micromonospora sp. MA102]